MKRACFWIFLFCLESGSLHGNSPAAPEFPGWSISSPRAEIAPLSAIDQKFGRKDRSSLRLATRRASDFGAWRKVFSDIKPGAPYRFSAWYHAEEIKLERRSVIARLEWMSAGGKPVRPPEFAIDVGREGRWTRVELKTRAPADARNVEVQLGLGFAAKATLWWDDVELVEDAHSSGRTIRLTTIYCRPHGMKSSEQSVEQFCRLAEGATEAKPDLVCLPEGITVIGTGKSYIEVSEAVPGPTTARLGLLAKKLNTYVVAGLYEREGEIVYNTAVLIDRKGRVVGKYRKTHLPREEWEAGLAAGDTYPVFDTDFGKVGLMICWDVQFPEPCRAMARQGAEVILLPIWGGSEILARARAIENHVFLATSSYDMKTFIIDPTGGVLAEATATAPVATAELRLDEKIYQPWLGDMRNRTWKEWRPDIQ